MNWLKSVMVMVVLLGLSIPSRADGVAENIGKMQTILDNLYDEMMPLCEKLIGVGQGVAGFAAIFYIGNRVWRHIANAEAVDFYPLFRPFVLGFCIMFFPLVLDLMNGLLKPTVTGTAAMVTDSNKAIETLMALKAEAIKSTKPWKMYVGHNNDGDKQQWLKYIQGLPEDAANINEGIFEGFDSGISFAIAKAGYRFRNAIKECVSEILNILFQAAALCIYTMSTFQRVVLSIIGPMVFGFAVFDGLQHTLTTWITKYINVYLWLPVCNIFGGMIGKIQEQMLKLDLDQIKTAGDTFFSTSDMGYLVFMVIAIIGYFTVPSAANFIVNAGGGSAMMQKVTSMAMTAAKGSAGGAVGLGKMTAGRAMEGVRNMANAKRNIKEGYSGANVGSGAMGAIGRIAGYAGSNLADKLAGSPSEIPDKPPHKSE
jgi:conjugative transposon TraJ protein